MQSSIIQRMGFTPLALPQTGLQPLMLLEQLPRNLFQRLFSGKTVRSTGGNIFTLFPLPSGKISLLTEGESQPVPSFKGYDILSARSLMAASANPTDTSLSSVNLQGRQSVNRKLLYRYQQVTIKTMHTGVLLEEHLNKYPVRRNIPGFLEKLKKGKLFVVTDVLQAQEFSIETVDDLMVKGELSVKAVQAYIKSNSSVTQKDKVVMHHKSKKAPVTIAIKAVCILGGHHGQDPYTYSISPKPFKSVRTNSKIAAKNGLPAEIRNVIL